jgi:peptidoglycan hydrolase-like protein with peptidoglycan-binding domain
VFVIKRGIKIVLSAIIMLVIIATPAWGATPPVQDPVICSCSGDNLPELAPSDPPLSGNHVAILQEQLLLLGLNPGPIDGSYGQATSDAVKVFQVLKGLKPDGVVDQKVWQALYQALNDSNLEDVDPESETSILIDRATRTLTVYIGGRFHRQYRVAVGKSETPTPLGDWRVIHRSKDWGTGFGTRWMGLNVPWGIYGIHGTNQPFSIGSFASHGCVRMFNNSVEDLYPLTRLGTVVKIIDSRLPYPPPVSARQLNPGTSGQQVVFLQWNLQDMGMPISSDGQYGRMTTWAVKYLQALAGMQPNGVFDAATKKLISLYYQPPEAQEPTGKASSETSGR